MPSAQAGEVSYAAAPAGPIVLPPSYFTSYTVTATLVNRTSCTLVGSRGGPTAGTLAPAPPQQISPGGTGTWKASGKSTMTGTPGTNAAVSIDLGPAIILLPPPHFPPSPVHPALGACGDFPA